MEISKERLIELEKAERKLNALERGGVDNWEFYGDALDEIFKEDRLEELLIKKFDTILECISEGIEEPAGRGCGYGIRGDTQDKAFEVFKKIIFSKEIKELTND